MPLSLVISLIAQGLHLPSMLWLTSFGHVLARLESFLLRYLAHQGSSPYGASWSDSMIHLKLAQLLNPGLTSAPQSNLHHHLAQEAVPQHWNRVPRWLCWGGKRLLLQQQQQQEENLQSHAWKLSVSTSGFAAKSLPAGWKLLSFQSCLCCWFNSIAV